MCSFSTVILLVGSFDL